LICSASFGSQNAAGEDQRTIILVVGAAGEEQYATEFNTWATNWFKAAEVAKAKCLTVGLPATAESESSEEKPASSEHSDTDREKLKRLLEAESKQTVAELWLVLIGHGTFNGKEAKFNLRGPDFSAAELGEWLKPYRGPTVIVNCASASAPFINALSASNRVIVTATRSGYELNYARLGKFLSEAIGDLKADLDKDGQTSLLEAFIFASKQATEFYKNEGRLATEHALLDDNGDGYGTPADWFRGVRALKKPVQGSSVDGLRANQLQLVRSEAEAKLTPAVRAKRDELELNLNKLREEKAQMAEDQYYAQLELILLQLANIYDQSEPASKSQNPGGPIAK